MMILWIAAILLGFVDCLAQVNWSYEIDDKNCDVFIQVNEDKNVLYLETMHIPGQYMTTSCWGTSATMCHINENDESYINGMKQNGAVTFLNNENQICYFENLGFRTGNMSGFFYQPWSYVYAVNIKVSCEDSSSIPMYCAKTEKMARQVLLAREELECAAKDGNFEGGVYPFEMPNGETEYCVAGRCDVCNSKWYDDFINHWKDSVCCDIRGKEPNTNNGTCVSPDSFDSTKVGVKHSRITAFPGCSQVTAGEENHFCKEPESSSTGSSSSEGSSSSAESSSSDGSSSSSAMLISSSSEEQESADCYTGVAEANAALYNADVECWSMQKESGYSLDGNGCLVGGCVDANSSDSMDDDDNNGESSNSEAGSSSSEEDRCVDVSLKKVSGEEADPWVYIGKEMYASRTVSYEKTKPSSKMFDALGRMYRQIKSRIKYYMGKETKVQKTVEVGEELDVWKMNEVVDGENIVSYRKFNKDSTIEIDSTIYEYGLYDVIELNFVENNYRHVDSSKVEYFAQYEEDGLLKKVFFLGLKNEEIYEENGLIKPYFTNVVHDTVFFDVSLINNSAPFSDAKYTSRTESERVILAKRIQGCSELREDPTMPNAQCIRYERSEISDAKSENIYFPGIGVNATFGFSYGRFNEDGFTCDSECDNSGNKVFYHAQSDLLLDEYIIVMASNWKKNVQTDEWEELCWKTEDMQATYDHESQHIRNARAMLEFAFHRHMITQESSRRFYDKAKCIEEGKRKMKSVVKNYDDWSSHEFLHSFAGICKNKDCLVSPSPTPTSQNREAISCLQR